MARSPFRMSFNTHSPPFARLIVCVRVFRCRRRTKMHARFSLFWNSSKKCKHINTSKPNGTMLVQMKLRDVRALTPIHIYLIYCLKKEPNRTRSEKVKRIAFILTYALIFRWKKRNKNKKKEIRRRRENDRLTASIYLFTFFCSPPLTLSPSLVHTFVIIFVFRIIFFWIRFVCWCDDSHDSQCHNVRISRVLCAGSLLMHDARWFRQNAVHERIPRIEPTWLYVQRRIESQ